MYNTLSMSNEAESNSPQSNERVWIGEDVSLKRNILIRPHGIEVARLVSSPGSFPEELTEEEEERFMASLRSRYAQSGLHAANFATTYAIEAYLEADNINSFEFPLAVTNLTEAPIFLPKDTKLLRFYIPPTRFIENGELKELVRNQTVHIDGKEEKDWKFVYKNRQGSEVDVIGVALRVNDDWRGYIPSSHEPISISGTEKEYRKEVDRFLRPVSSRQNPLTSVLWIGETVPLHLNNQVTAEIERDAYPGFVGNSLRETTGEHINSRLIDPSTGWPVRVEIYSPTAGDHVADWVIFKFFRQ